MLGEKECQVQPIGVQTKQPSNWYFGCFATELLETRSRLGCLIRSIMTNLLHTARIGISICNAIRNDDINEDGINSHVC